VCLNGQEFVVIQKRLTRKRFPQFEHNPFSVCISEQTNINRKGREGHKEISIYYLCVLCVLCGSECFLCRK
jgi:hypothetical protein